MSKANPSGLPPGWGRILANLQDDAFCERLFGSLEKGPRLRRPRSATARVALREKILRRSKRR
jgi:hypothetical protein